MGTCLFLLCHANALPVAGIIIIQLFRLNSMEQRIQEYMQKGLILFRLFIGRFFWF